MKYVRFSSAYCTARDFEAKTYDQVNHSGLRISAWTQRLEAWEKDKSVFSWMHGFLWPLATSAASGTQAMAVEPDYKHLPSSY